MTRRWRIPLFVAALALLVIVVPSAIRFYTDWLWFGETGYQDVFVTTLTAQGTLAGAAMVLALGVLLLNLRMAMRTISPRELVLVTREGPIAITVDRQHVQPVGTALAVVVALLFGVFASAQWQDWLLFRHAQPFGDVDPVLGKDVGFYVFQLPFLEALRGYLLALVALAGVLAGAVYVVAGAVDVDSEPRPADCASGEAPPGRARRRAAPRARVRRVSRRAQAADDAGWHHPRRRERRCGVRIPALRVLMVAALAGRRAGAVSDGGRRPGGRSSAQRPCTSSWPWRGRRARR